VTVLPRGRHSGPRRGAPGRQKIEPPWLKLAPLPRALAGDKLPLGGYVVRDANGQALAYSRDISIQEAAYREGAAERAPGVLRRSLVRFLS
jgi:hypothetical protein